MSRLMDFWSQFLNFQESRKKNFKTQGFLQARDNLLNSQKTCRDSSSSEIVTEASTWCPAACWLEIEWIHHVWQFSLSSATRRSVLTSHQVKTIQQSGISGPGARSRRIPSTEVWTDSTWSVICLVIDHGDLWFVHVNVLKSAARAKLDVLLNVEERLEFALLQTFVAAELEWGGAIHILSGN